MSVEMRATVLEASPLGRADSNGTAMYALALSVEHAGHAVRRAVVSTPVPERCRHLLGAGTSLPLRTLETHPDAIAIDWDCA